MLVLSEAISIACPVSNLGELFQLSMCCMRTKWLSTDALWPRERPITCEGVIPEMFVSAHYHCDVNITDGRDTYFRLIMNNLSAEVIKVSYKFLFHYRCSLYCLMFVVVEICGAYFVLRRNIYTDLPYYLRTKTANTENLLLNCSKRLPCALTDWLTSQLTAHASNYSGSCLRRTEYSYKPDQANSYFNGKRRFIIVLLRAWNWGLFEPV
jgi:hypothetical protein